MRPRPQIEVIYELELITADGNERVEEFSHIFDKEIYEEDIDGTDVMMVHFKMDELKEKYGELFLLEFTIERGNMCH